MNFKKHNISILKKVINLYISCTLGAKLRHLNADFTLGHCLFGSVKLTKIADLDKYKYTGYGIGFDSCSEFLFTDGSYRKNVIIFGADLSAHLSVLIISEGPIQGLDDTTLTAEAKFSIDFTQSGKRFVLSLHYNESKSFLFGNATKVYQFKA